MPLYEYYCPDCRTRFSALRSMREADDPIACENCERERPARVLSTFAIHGKGGSAVAEMDASPSAGGCCGGACGCGHSHS